MLRHYADLSHASGSEVLPDISTSPDVPGRKLLHRKVVAPPPSLLYVFTTRDEPGSCFLQLFSSSSAAFSTTATGKKVMKLRRADSIGTASWFISNRQ